VAISVQPNYQSILSFNYPGARPLYIRQNAHVARSRRSTVLSRNSPRNDGLNSYLSRRSGILASATGVRARSRQAARTPIAGQVRRAQVKRFHRDNFGAPSGRGRRTNYQEGAV
jgi:hypothetical protein